MDRQNSHHYNVDHVCIPCSAVKTRAFDAIGGSSISSLGRVASSKSDFRGEASAGNGFYCFRSVTSQAAQ